MNVYDNFGLDMVFPDIKTRVLQIRSDYYQGQITMSKVQDELFDLMVRDENDVWWMIGFETFEWYFYDTISENWIHANSPLHTEYAT